MTVATPEPRHYSLIAEAIRYLDGHRREQPSLATVARHVGLSEFHLQRLFSAWAGVSPKQFLHYLTWESARARLREAPVLDAALAAGLSGPGRLHDLMLQWEGMTPGEFRQGGAGLDIRYGVIATPFGSALVAETGRGLCKLAFFDTEAQFAALEAELATDWPAATRQRDDAAVTGLAARIFPENGLRQGPLKLLLAGSPFQQQVWAALLAIPPGGLRSYADIAAGLGRPDATRAVASAIARNDLGYLIPCHRVIRSTGDFNQYRWGAERKQAMIVWEAARADRANRAD